eukprot:403370130
MRTIATTAILALSVLATVTNASFNPVDFVKNKFFSKKPSQAEITKNVAAGTWPDLEWPADQMSQGVLYHWNETTKELVQFANATVDTYLDITHNREKIVTQMEIPNIGFAEVLTYVDAKNHVAYQKIPKIEQCKTYELPKELNLTSFWNDLTNETSGMTKYEGIVSLPWVTDMTFHKFHIQSAYINETVFFCTKCHKVKWIITDDQPNYVLNTPAGPVDRVYTDADFDGLTCTSLEAPVQLKKLSSHMF